MVDDMKRLAMGCTACFVNISKDECRQENEKLHYKASETESQFVTNQWGDTKSDTTSGGDTMPDTTSGGILCLTQTVGGIKSIPPRGCLKQTIGMDGPKQWGGKSPLQFAPCTQTHCNA